MVNMAEMNSAFCLSILVVRIRREVCGVKCVFRF
jgi:hypothetical protein